MTPALLPPPWSCPTSLDLPPPGYCLTRPQLLIDASPPPGGEGHRCSRPVAVHFAPRAGEVRRAIVDDRNARTRMVCGQLVLTGEARPLAMKE